MNQINEIWRVCTKCEKRLPIKAFDVYRANGYTGIRGVCHTCERARRIAWDKENRERLNEHRRRSHLKRTQNPEFMEQKRQWQADHRKRKTAERRQAFADLNDQGFFSISNLAKHYPITYTGILWLVKHNRVINTQSHGRRFVNEASLKAHLFKNG